MGFLMNLAGIHSDIFGGCDLPIGGDRRNLRGCGSSDAQHGRWAPCKPFAGTYNMIYLTGKFQQIGYTFLGPLVPNGPIVGLSVVIECRFLGPLVSPTVL